MTDRAFRVVWLVGGGGCFGWSGWVGLVCWLVRWVGVFVLVWLLSLLDVVLLLALLNARAGRALADLEGKDASGKKNSLSREGRLGGWRA